MTDKDDRELERYLSGGSPLSRRYREVSRESTPPELDDTVLALARAAAARKPRPGRWLTPLALAASVVLGINVAWNLREHAGAPGTLAVVDLEAGSPAAQPEAAPQPEHKSEAEAKASAPTAATAAPPPAGRSAPRVKAPAAATEDAMAVTAYESEAQDRAAATSAAQQAPGARVELRPAEESARKASESRLGQLPDGWYLRGNNAAAFEAATDESVTHSSPQSLALWRSGRGSEGCGRLERVVPAEAYRGKPVRFSATVKAQGINRFSALGMAVDDDRPRQSELARGDSSWHAREVVVDVPAEAERLAQSVLLCGAGTIWIDDAKLEAGGSRGAMAD